MKAVAHIADEASYKRAQDRVHQLMNNWRTRDELEEGRALSAEITRYSKQRHRIHRGKPDAATHLELALDMENTTLELLDSLLGGREAVIDVMTRRRRLTESEVDRLAARLRIDRDWLDRDLRKPEGWHDIIAESELPPDHWRAVLLAHREAKAARGSDSDAPESSGTDANASGNGAVSQGTQHETQREPELATTT